MDLEQAIRTRRTHKACGPEPLDRETLDALFELARWAPNHKLTNPWRFRVIGPRALERLKHAAGNRVGHTGAQAGLEGVARRRRRQDVRPTTSRYFDAIRCVRPARWSSIAAGH